MEQSLIDMSIRLTIRLYSGPTGELLVHEDKNGTGAFIPDPKFSKQYCINYLNDLWRLHEEKIKEELPKFSDFQWVEVEVSQQRHKYLVENLLANKSVNLKMNSAQYYCPYVPINLYKDANNHEKIKT